MSAPAKVNLVLRVLGRRADGYHDIDTLFQAVDLTDEVAVEIGGDGVVLSMDGPDLGPPEENLAYRAAEEFLAEFAPGSGARVQLTKRIPVGAGLGGGSSDAAAVLRCLAVLHDVGAREKLMRIGAALGADVPFFLGHSALARGRGRGEELQPRLPLPPAHLVLVAPPVHVSTAGAYAALAESRRFLSPPKRGEPALVLDGWEHLTTLAYNDFEPVISSAHPEISLALHELRTLGADVALMTGSGSTCFGLFSDQATADAAAEALRISVGWPCHSVRTAVALPEAKRG